MNEESSVISIWVQIYTYVREERSSRRNIYGKEKRVKDRALWFVS